jgi:hypothetical protein
MTPEQATQWLDNRAVEFAARSAAPVPSRGQVESAYDAEVRLAALTSNVDWIRKFTAGSPAERREYEELKAIIADGADETGMSIRVGDAEVVEGPFGVRRSDLFGALSDMNKIGIPVEGLERFLDGNFSEEDQLWAQQSLDRAMATKEWTDGLLRGDPTCLHEFTAWCAVVSAGKTL